MLGIFKLKFILGSNNYDMLPRKTLSPLLYLSLPLLCPRVTAANYEGFFFNFT